VAGNYTVYYTTNNAVAPCENDTAGVSLIIENCLCPSVALTAPTNDLCSESGTQNLNDFLITTEAGTWSITGVPAGTKPAVLAGTNFVTNQSDDGIYTLRFTLSQPVAGCPAFAEINLEVIQTPAIQLDNAICAGDLLTWEATVVTTAEVVTNSSGVLTPLGGNRYRITNLTPGVGIQVTASNGSGLCSTVLNIAAPDCDCEIAIGTLPDDVSLCPGESMTYTASVTGGKGQVTSFWIVANDSLYQSTIVVDQSGAYTFVSIDSLGCRDEHIINSTIYTEMVADIDMTAITCPGDNDGTITIFGILGGNGPYSVSLNNGAFQPISTFPFTFSNLGQGNYDIEIRDVFNCSIHDNAIISSASSETLTLGPDETILVGDSVLIQAILSFTPDTFTWSGDIAEIKTDQLSSWASPEEDMSLTLVAVDEKGCVYTDDIKIRVLLSSSVIVPNIFSPNDDGINDLLIPSMDPSIVSVEYFEIFSRWGELVYSKTNFLPQDNVAWDGKLKGKEMNPGVFLYRILATNKKGQEIALYGDLTLVR
jgi:gliding motility-associated-like protein